MTGDARVRRTSATSLPTFKGRVGVQAKKKVLEAKILGRGGRMYYTNYDFSRDILGWRWWVGVEKGGSAFSWEEFFNFKT